MDQNSTLNFPLCHGHVANPSFNSGSELSSPNMSSISNPKNEVQEFQAPEIQKKEKKICRWVIYDGTICGQNFSNIHTFNRHVRETHKGIRPFACHLCEKSYGRKDYLNRHMGSHVATLKKISLCTVGHLLAKPLGNLKIETNKCFMMQ